MQDFKELDVWKKARQLSGLIYRSTRQFPSEERWGMTRQVRDAVISVASNIAEGRSRGTKADFARFCRIALGSLFEVDSLCTIAGDLGFLPLVEFSGLEKEIESTRRMLIALIRTLEE